MMDHREAAADDVYHMILYNLLCFVSVPVFILGGAARKVAGINYQNPIAESCHDHSIKLIHSGATQRDVLSDKMML